MRILLALATLVLASPAAAIPYLQSGTFTSGADSDKPIVLQTNGFPVFPLDRGVLSLSFTANRPLARENLTFYAIQYTGYVDIDTATDRLVDASDAEYETDFADSEPVRKGSILFKLPPNTVGRPQYDFYDKSVVEYRGFDAYILFYYSVPAGEAPIDYTFRIDKIADVPEPATWALLLAGFGGVGAVLRRRRVPDAA